MITRSWPEILGVDFAAVALVVGDRGFRADRDSLERVESAFVERMFETACAVQIGSVECGHALFGPAAAGKVRAQALIRIDGRAPFPRGLLAIGQQAELAVESRHGSALLLFLGRVVAATVRRFVATA